MMSWFASGFFAKSPVLAAPLIGLFVFLAVFAIVTARALFKNRDDIEHAASLPLESDDGRPSHGQ